MPHPYSVNSSYSESPNHSLMSPNHSPIAKPVTAQPVPVEDQFAKAKKVALDQSAKETMTKCAKYKIEVGNITIYPTDLLKLLNPDSDKKTFKEDLYLKAFGEHTSVSEDSYTSALSTLQKNNLIEITTDVKMVADKITRGCPESEYLEMLEDCDKQYILLTDSGKAIANLIEGSGSTAGFLPKEPEPTTWMEKIAKWLNDEFFPERFY